MTDRERHRRAQELLLEALELPTADQEAFLQSAAPDDPELQQEVRSLLAALERPGMVDAVVEGDAAPSDLGRVGPFVLRRLLGEGGMGSVFLADRMGEDYEQQVALKLVRTGYFDPRLEARFREERRILARLRHPGIAQLLDGGLTEEGRPYFALEYVEGTPLLEHCTELELDLETRLRLFLDICAPVSYAHQQLVIHRDLKPANILVTADGHVKLLDFGVAKLLDDPNESDTATRTAPWVTPAYAAPEQVRGEAVGVATDIYALGIVLYEMLTGSRPYDVGSSLPPSEVERIVCEVTPTRPSKVVTGDTTTGEPAVRGTTTGRLSRKLSGDLDTIVLKALAKEPARRYESIAAFAEDVERYLEGRPVRARPDTVAYRTRKFVTRHRGAVAAAAVVAITVVVGGVSVVRSAREATAQRDLALEQAQRADQVASIMLDIFQLSDPARSLGDTVTALGVLEAGTARIREELAEQPETRAELLTHVADVYARLGQLEQSESLAREALDVRTEALGPDHPETAVSLGQVGRFAAELGRANEAAPLLERAYANRAAANLPQDTSLATIEGALAARIRAQGEFDRARELWQHSLDVRRAVYGDGHPRVVESLVGLASTLHDSGDFGAAEAVLREIVESGRGSAIPSAEVADAAISLGEILTLRERYLEAEPVLAEALRIREQLYDPGHPDHIEARQHMVAALLGLGRFSEAEAMGRDTYQAAVGTWGRVHPQVTSIRVALARALQALDAHDEAIALQDTALAHKRTHYAGDHGDIMYNHLFAAEHAAVAERWDQAMAHVDTAVAMRERLSAGSPESPGVTHILEHSLRARFASASGDQPGAAEHFERAVEVAEERLRPTHRYRLRVLRERARWWNDQGEYEAAAAALEEVLLAYRSRFGDAPEMRHPLIGHTLRELARARLGMGEAETARPLLEEALEHYQQFPDIHRSVREARALLRQAEAGS